MLYRSIKEAAPEKYWDVLFVSSTSSSICLILTHSIHSEPDFDIAAKRRIYDSGYLASLHSPNFELIQGAIAKFNPKSVVTNEGKEVAADLVVLCTVGRLSSEMERGLTRRCRDSNRKNVGFVPQVDATTGTDSSLVAVLFPLKVINDQGESLQEVVSPCPIYPRREY